MDSINDFFEYFDLYGVNINFLFRKKNYYTSKFITAISVLMLIVFISILIIVCKTYSTSAVPDYLTENIFLTEASTKESWLTTSDELGYFNKTLPYPDELNNNKTFFQFSFGFRNTKEMYFEQIDLNYFNVKISSVYNNNETLLFFDSCKRIKGIDEYDFLYNLYSEFYCVYSNFELSFSEKNELVKKVNFEMNRCRNNTYSYIPIISFNLFDKKMLSYLQYISYINNATICQDLNNCTDIFEEYLTNKEDLSEYDYINTIGVDNYLNSNERIEGNNQFSAINRINNYHNYFNGEMYALKTEVAHRLALIARKRYNNKTAKDIINYRIDYLMQQLNGLSSTNLVNFNNNPNSDNSYSNPYYSINITDLNKDIYKYTEKHDYLLRHFPIQCESEENINNKLKELEIVIMFSDNRVQVLEKDFKIIKEQSYHTYYPSEDLNQYYMYLKQTKVVKNNGISIVRGFSVNKKNDNTTNFSTTLLASKYPGIKKFINGKINNNLLLSIDLLLPDKYESIYYNDGWNLYLIGISGGIIMLIYCLYVICTKYISRFKFYLKLAEELQIKYNYEYKIPSFKDYIKSRYNDFKQMKKIQSTHQVDDFPTNKINTLKKFNHTTMDLQKKSVKSLKSLMNSFQDKKLLEKTINTFIILNEFFDEEKVELCHKTYKILEKFDKINSTTNAGFNKNNKNEKSNKADFEKLSKKSSRPNDNSNASSKLSNNGLDDEHQIESSSDSDNEKEIEKNIIVKDNENNEESIENISSNLDDSKNQSSIVSKEKRKKISNIIIEEPIFSNDASQLMKIKSQEKEIKSKILTKMTSEDKPQNMAYKTVYDTQFIKTNTVTSFENNINTTNRDLINNNNNNEAFNIELKTNNLNVKKTNKSNKENFIIKSTKKLITLLPIFKMKTVRNEEAIVYKTENLNIDKENSDRNNKECKDSYDKMDFPSIENSSPRFNIKQNKNSSSLEKAINKNRKNTEESSFQDSNHHRKNSSLNYLTNESAQLNNKSNLKTITSNLNTIETNRPLNVENTDTVINNNSLKLKGQRKSNLRFHKNEICKKKPIEGFVKPKLIIKSNERVNYESWLSIFRNESSNTSTKKRLSFGNVLRKVILKKKLFKMQILESVYNVFSKRELQYSYSMFDNILFTICCKKALFCRKYKQINELKKHIKSRMSLETLIESLRSFDSIKRTIIQEENRMVLDNLPKMHIKATKKEENTKNHILFHTGTIINNSKSQANISSNDIKNRLNILNENKNFFNKTKIDTLKKKLMRKYNIINSYYTAVYHLSKKGIEGHLDKNDYYELMNVEYLINFLRLERLDRFIELSNKYTKKTIEEKTHFLKNLQSIIEYKEDDNKHSNDQINEIQEKNEKRYESFLLYGEDDNNYKYNLKRKANNSRVYNKSAIIERNSLNQSKFNNYNNTMLNQSNNVTFVNQRNNNDTTINNKSYINNTSFRDGSKKVRNLISKTQLKSVGPSNYLEESWYDAYMNEYNFEAYQMNDLEEN